jgi:hypothetical protein
MVKLPARSQSVMVRMYEDELELLDKEVDRLNKLSGTKSISRSNVLRIALFEFAASKKEHPGGDPVGEGGRPCRDSADRWSLDWTTMLMAEMEDDGSEEGDMIVRGL